MRLPKEWDALVRRLSHEPQRIALGDGRWFLALDRLATDDARAMLLVGYLYRHARPVSSLPHLLDLDNQHDLLAIHPRDDDQVDTLVSGWVVDMAVLLWHARHTNGLLHRECQDMVRAAYRAGLLPRHELAAIAMHVPMGWFTSREEYDHYMSSAAAHSPHNTDEQLNLLTAALAAGCEKFGRV